MSLVEQALKKMQGKHGATPPAPVRPSMPDAAPAPPPRSTVAKPTRTVHIDREALRAGLTLAATKSQYLDGVRDTSRIAPDNWVHDQALLDRAGIDEIMLDLFKDYGTNVALYPQFQNFFRTRRPPTLIVWGQNDVIFPADGARPVGSPQPAVSSRIPLRNPRTQEGGGDISVRGS